MSYSQTRSGRRSASPFSQFYRVAALCLFGTVVLLGCATVKPAADYERAGVIIQERTGVAEIFDPTLEDTIESKVSALLEGGLDIDEAVAVAFLNNASFQGLFLEIGASRAEVVQSRLLSNPSLSLSARFPDTGGRTNVNAGIAQQLADLWQIPVRKKIAEANLEKTISSVAKAAVDLRAEVKSAYYRLVTAQEMNRIIQESLLRAEDSLRLARSQFDAGESLYLDVNFVKANELSVTALRMLAERDEKLRMNEFTHLLGLSSTSGDIALVETPPSADVNLENEEALILQGMEERFDAQMAAFDTKAAEEAVREQYRSIFPDLTLGLEVEQPEQAPIPGRFKQGMAAFRPGIDSSPTFPTQRERNLDLKQVVDYLIGPTLQITLPIFDQNQAQIAKSRIVAEQKRKDYTQLLQRIAEEIVAATESARTASALVTLYTEQSLPLAKTNLDSAWRAYQAGEVDIQAFLAAQQELLSRQREFADIAGEYALAIATLERALGGQLRKSETIGATPAEQPNG